MKKIEDKLHERQAMGDKIFPMVTIRKYPYYFSASYYGGGKANGHSNKWHSYGSQIVNNPSL